MVDEFDSLTPNPEQVAEHPNSEVEWNSLQIVPSSEEVGLRVERMLNTAEQLTASWSKSFYRYDQRRDHRIPHQSDLLLVPVFNETEMPNGDPGLVLCKDISNGGFAFFHQHPIVHRKVAVLLPTALERQELMVAKLVWCRFTRHNFYCSGAKILRKATFPFEERWTEMDLSNW
ncbi:MAG: hypothetical protein R3C11_05080 [Planctomycetaceae bacterium]